MAYMLHSGIVHSVELSLDALLRCKVRKCCIVALWHSEMQSAYMLLDNSDSDNDDDNDYQESDDDGDDHNDRLCSKICLPQLQK